MNREKHFRNRIVAALIIAALLLVQSVPAFAVDSTATATGFYYSKAKAENRIKLRKQYGPEVYNDAKEL